MLRSAAIASARAALRLAALSSQPSILHRSMAAADPTVCVEHFLTLNSVPRLQLEFSRSYAGGRARHEEEFEEDENEGTDEEDFSETEDLDHDFDDDDDFDDGDGETRD